MNIKNFMLRKGRNSLFSSFVFCLLLIVLFGSQPLNSETITLYPTDDGWIRENDGGVNSTGETIGVGYSTTYGNYRSVLKFDLSAIPSGSTINSAYIKLYYSSYSGSYSNRNIRAYRVTSNWNQSTISWNISYYPAYYDDNSVGGGTAGWYSWNIKILVQYWTQGTYNNYGVMMKCYPEDGTFSNILFFRSKEYTLQTYRPRLEINYTPPAPDPDLVSVSGIPSSITLGQSFPITIVAENEGELSIEGAINVSMSGNPGITNISSFGTLYNKSVGSTIYNNNCVPMISSNRLIEAVDDYWTKNESHTLSMTVTPYSTGTMYIWVRTTMKVGTNGGECIYANDTSVTNGDGNYTDQQGWTARRFSLTVTEQTYNLNIDVDNISVGSQSLPGTNGKVYLYDNSENFITSDQTDSNGIASFYNLPEGTYKYRIYVTSPSGLGTEFWGHGSIYVNSNTNHTHTRDWPYVKSVELANDAGQTINWGDAVPLGTHVWAFVTLKNPSTLSSRSGVKARAVLDQNQDTYYDNSGYSLSSTLFANDEAQFPVDLGTLDILGDYYFAGFANATYMNSEITDIWNYDSNYKITVSGIPNHAPTAPADEINGQPSTMYPGTEYTVTSRYYDEDGSNDLRFCYLKIDHPSATDLTLRWEQGTWSTYVESGSSYVTINSVDRVEITGAQEGYRLTWHFVINPNWTETASGIRFGVCAEDDYGLISGYDYDNSNASFLLLGSGVTIITHGYTPDGTNPTDGWMKEMAQAILYRAGKGRIRVYEKSTGQFDIKPEYHSGSLPPPAPGGEEILIFDWMTESRINESGYSEAAADALFSALLKADKNNDFSLINLHFIGHSRGCVVNSEAVQRLLAIGKTVEHVTYLDPHDWGYAGVICDDHDVNPGIYISNPLETWPNDGVIGWEGVGWIDTYYQNDSNILPTHLSGRLVEGTYSVKLDDSEPDIIGHSDVHTWYLGTIDYTKGIDEWYTGNHTRESGFYFTRYGEGKTNRPDINGNQEPILENTSIESIFNGNFSKDWNGWGWPLIPGWSEHGGDGDGHVDTGYLVLEEGSTSRTHNFFYLPNNAEEICFKYNIFISDEADILKVFLGGVTKIFEVPLNQNYFQYEKIPIPSQFKNSVTTITFKIVTGDSIVNSEVWIDDVKLTLESSVNSCPLTPIPYVPEGAISTLTPTFEWSTFQDGGDGNTQNGYQIRVWCDTDGDIKVYDTGFINDVSGSTHVYNPGEYTGIDPETGDTMISNPLEWDKQYHWHVRYQDSSGDWSEWSAVDPNPHKDFYTLPSYPQITFLTPDSGPVGTGVIISGTHFGQSQGTVTFNGVNASINSWIETQIDTVVPPGATTGPVVVHTNTGQASNGITFILTIPYEVKSADFNKDGRADVIWRYQGPEGYNAVWLLGTSTGASASITAISNKITPEGLANMNLETGSEISRENVWESIESLRTEPVKDGFAGQSNGNNNNRTALEDPFTVDTKSSSVMATSVIDPRDDPQAVELPEVADQNWKLCGTADFNDDGNIDIVWSNVYNAQNCVWYMVGTTFAGYGRLPDGSTTDWVLGGVGDFDLDGNPDMMWNNVVDGRNGVWYLEGLQIKNIDIMTTGANVDWKLCGTGDFNSDGKTDLVWRNISDGRNAVWYMDGVELSSVGWLDTVGNLDWKLRGTGDFNNDGKTDLIWTNTSDGRNCIWYLEGVTLTTVEFLTTVTDTNWEIRN